MRVALPHSNSYPYVTVILITPKGEAHGDGGPQLSSCVDIPLPEGVEEDEVDVYSCFRDAGGQVPSGCGPALIQAAVRKIESALSMLGLQVAEPVAEAAPARCWSGRRSAPMPRLRLPRCPRRCGSVADAAPAAEWLPPKWPRCRSGPLSRLRRRSAAVPMRLRRRCGSGGSGGRLRKHEVAQDERN